MNRISSLRGAGSLLAAATIVLMTTLPANTAAANASPIIESVFCSNLATKSNKITTDLTNLINKVTAAWAQQDTSLTAHANSVDQKVTAERQQADAARAAAYTKLATKATTSVEKTAVQAYEATITTAVTSRRSAYDAARADFRSGLKTAILARRSTITDQFNSFKTSVNSALNTASDSCTNDPSSGAAFRAALVASLKTARTTFQGERADDDKVRTDAKSLAATRDAAFKAADQTFQASAAAARAALKSAFGNSSASI